MDNDFGRQNEAMRDLVEAALREVAATGGRAAAESLHLAGMPCRVICRVLAEPERRRLVSPY